MIKVGSLFAGIGGFEKGIEDAFDGMADTVWQVEQNSFCQKVLKKHWPNATIYDDVCTVGKHNLEPVHILCGGFPCQSISVAGKMEGLENENKSGLWWEMHRIISELRPRIAILENVANVLSVGGPDVVGSLAEIGYDCEWTVIRASDFGAPHRRARWFCVAYDTEAIKNKRWSVTNTNKVRFRTQNSVQSRRSTIDAHDSKRNVAYPNSTTTTITQKKTSSNSKSPKRDSIGEKIGEGWKKSGRWKAFHYFGYSAVSFSKETNFTYSNGACKEQPPYTFSMGKKERTLHRIREGFRDNKRTGNWGEFPTQSPVCRRDDGIPNRMDRIAALGNAIVPQCSEWVARQVLNSGLLDDLLQEIK